LGVEQVAWLFRQDKIQHKVIDMAERLYKMGLKISPPVLSPFIAEERPLLLLLMAAGGDIVIHNNFVVLL
jgi:hypothetical protein